MNLSLVFFAATPPEARGGAYDLMLTAARAADEAGLEAVWTPERHFHPFGGAFPRPSLTSAAIAATTRRIHVRAGSVVLPLDHPVRVTEDWSVVDNLSGGRVGVSFASGWSRGDFLLAAQPYARRHEVLWRDLETVRALWRGDHVTCVDRDGNTYNPLILPRPVQQELPVWVTTAASPESARSAGRIGANLLTHTLGQTFPQLAELVAAYRSARREVPGVGRVTVMLHTYLEQVTEQAARTARIPLQSYLRASIGLSAASLARLGVELPTEDLSEDDWDALLGYAATRYIGTSSLIGSPARCHEVLEQLADLGVDEVGCLVDFGVPDGAVLRSLALLVDVHADLRARDR